MLIPTVIMGVLAIILVFFSYQKGLHIQGLKITGGILWQMLPILILALVVAGMVQVLVPREIISRWIGEASGLRGILIGTVIGGFMPGGPYVSLPIAAGLMRAGASIGTMVAFITGWSILAFTRLPIEIGVMGWKFTLIRLACSFFFPPIAGLIAGRLFGTVRVI